MSMYACIIITHIHISTHCHTRSISKEFYTHMYTHTHTQTHTNTHICVYIYRERYIHVHRSTSLSYKVHFKSNNTLSFVEFSHQPLRNRASRALHKTHTSLHLKSRMRADITNESRRVTKDVSRMRIDLSRMRTCATEHHELL